MEQCLAQPAGEKTRNGGHLLRIRAVPSCWQAKEPESRQAQIGEWRGFPRFLYLRPRGRTIAAIARAPEAWGGAIAKGVLHEERTDIATSARPDRRRRANRACRSVLRQCRRRHD